MSADWIIENATVVTMNPKREILSGASVAISGVRIAAVGPSAEMGPRYPDARRIDGRGKVVLPGMINCHTHVGLSLQKGVTLAVPEGLYKVMWPVEKALTADDCYIGALAGAAEALKSGSTTIVDHYFFMEQVARATTEIGLRGVLGHTIMSRLGPITGEQELDAGLAFARDWKGRHPLVTPWLAPHATDTVDRAWLLRLRQAATDMGVGLHLHVAQSRREREFIRETFGMGCVEYLDSLDFLGKDVFAVHCIYIDESEDDLLVRSGAHPVYCPMAHCMSAHPMRAWDILQKGAGVLIGTDCVSSNNVMDIVGELRIAGAAQKQLTGNPEAMPASRILEMVTVDAAAAIGMGDQLGALVPGYLADLIVLDASGLHMAPNYSVLDNIVYCCNGRDVENVFVNGRLVVHDGELTTISEIEVVAQVEQRGRSMIQRAVAQDPSLAWLWQR